MQVVAEAQQMLHLEVVLEVQVVAVLVLHTTTYKLLLELPIQEAEVVAVQTLLVQHHLVEQVAPE
jgi:hypothetical protein